MSFVYRKESFLKWLIDNDYYGDNYEYLALCDFLETSKEYIVLLKFFGGDSVKFVRLLLRSVFYPYKNHFMDVSLTAAVSKEYSFSPCQNYGFDTFRRYVVWYMMEQRDVRLASFDDWNFKVKASKKDFVDAGLFFTGSNDSVVCYHCFVSLHHWDFDDIPSLEHDKHRPECGLKFKAMIALEPTQVLTDDSCVVCLDNKRSRVLVPCGHLCLCAACHDKLSKASKYFKCPLCQCLSRGMIVYV